MTTSRCRQWSALCFLYTVSFCSYVGRKALAGRPKSSLNRWFFKWLLRWPLTWNLRKKRDPHDGRLAAGVTPDNVVEKAKLLGTSTRIERTRNSSSIALYMTLWVMALMLFVTPFPSEAQSSPTTTACPLNFTVLNKFPLVANNIIKGGERCTARDTGLQLVISLYLRESGFFQVPSNATSACADAYQSQLQSQGVPADFNVSTSCPPNFLLSGRGTHVCGNIQTPQEFANVVPAKNLNPLRSSCEGAIGTETECSSCNIPVLSVQNAVSAVEANSSSNRTDGACNNFTILYTAGIVNRGGPLDPGTAYCLFYITPLPGGGRNNLKFIGVGVGGMLFLGIVGTLIFYVRYRRRRAADRAARKKRTKDMLSASTVPTSSINWFDIDDLKTATKNFHRDNMLGTGGYGNVYKGTLADGTEVAAKRFKNCSPAGDKDFVHEVEMISSVRHRHLVGIRGCCVASAGLAGVNAGHQRIIVYDYMPNGSLQEHLFPQDSGGRSSRVLDWPSRRKIAIGTAKGLDYLHHDALPAIFHRDIKSSNILLDNDFNALLADFGLAKFTPEGVSHVSTQAAGTKGYIAPEYAIYGQLTDKSDVYSFGMVLLELVTGRKALSSGNDDPPRTLLADWAWPQVRQGRWKEIIDPRLRGDVGSDEEMEKFILVAHLCAHPQVHCRPSIDQALKMLESNDLLLPSNVPDRPLPLTSGQVEIEDALYREAHRRRRQRHGGGGSSRTGFSSFGGGGSSRTGFSSFSASTAGTASNEFSSGTHMPFSSQSSAKPDLKESPLKSTPSSNTSPTASAPPSGAQNDLSSENV